MVESLSQLHGALAAFGDRMGDTRLLPLAVALGLHLASLLVRSGVWCGILRSAFPGRRVEAKATAWAYLAGVGVNVLAPFRGGDVVRIYAIKRHIGDASVATIVSTLVAETAFGLPIVAAMVAATAALGWLPPIVHLPDAKAFEFSFYARHAALVAVAIGVLVAVAAILAEWTSHHLEGLWSRLVDGLRILRSPGRFVRVVAAPQVVDWILRVGVAYALLDAFGVPPAVRYAVAVVVIDSVSTALPFTPGGVGAQQGLLAFALAGVAPAGTVLAFSIGAQAAILGFNVLAGLVAIFALFGHGGVRSLHRTARAATET